MKNKEILPNYINNSDFRYITLDNIIITSLILVDYPKSAGFIQIVESLPKDIDYDFSVHIKKQNTKEVLKEITQNILISSTELKTVNKNQIDIDIISKTKEDALQIRRDIQINNEEIYNVYAYVTIYTNIENGKDYLLGKLKKIESKLYAKQLISNAANFRQIQSYLSTLPINYLSNELVRGNYRNFTTSSLMNMFPFYTNNIFDINGVIFGKNTNDNKICNVDIFDEKYSNANMCIFGSSGSGKSYFAKLHIIRQYVRTKKQYIFDPEGEYISVSKKIGGESIFFNCNKENKYINFLDILPEEVEINKDSFFDMKVTKVLDIIKEFIDMEDIQSEILVNCIKNAYYEKGINESMESMYIESDNNKFYLKKVIKGSKYMPIFEDVYKNIIKSKSIKYKEMVEDLSTKFNTNILSQNRFLNNRTSINLDANLINFDLSKVDIKVGEILIKHLLKIIEVKNSTALNSQKEKFVIYVDEIWKYISLNESSKLAKIIFTLYKTIRKSGGSIISITQDISDFLEYEKGVYGKSILNNSSFKMLFKLDYSEFDVLNRLSTLTTETIKNLASIEKGQAILLFKNNSLKLNIKASRYENDIIKEE